MKFTKEKIHIPLNQFESENVFTFRATTKCKMR